jgi:O-antigen/teichoic acid export membrane protein
LNLKEIKGYIKELYKYSHPLFAFYLVAVLLGIFDRWLLQIAGGSDQQGYYGLSYQIGAACFLFSCAMTPLIAREFSIAYVNNDFKRIADLFQKHIPLLYSITAFFACFIAVNADSVSVVMGGVKFRPATMAIAIMAFYPIHQTYGQLSGSLFFATDRTRLYRNIGIIFGLIGLPLSYFLIAPKKLFGLEAGAAGLAIKMVLLQFLMVNSQIYFNAKLLKLSFRRFLTHQIITVLFLLAISALARVFVNYILKFTASFVMNFLAIGAIYTILVFFSIYLMPELFGLNKDSLKSFMSGFKVQT